jgi:hypothetical protein
MACAVRRPKRPSVAAYDSRILVEWIVVSNVCAQVDVIPREPQDLDIMYAADVCAS